MSIHRPRAAREREARATVATGNGSGRGWLQSISVGPSGGTYNLSMTYAPDGDVLAANDKANGNWTYTYDDFNRLITAGKATQAFSYVYDRFGNRWQQNVTLGTGPNPVYTFDAKNRITGSSITYDAAGNVMNGGTHSYTYDAENRIITVDGGVTAQYTYEADGHRIRKVTSSSTLDYIFDLEGRAVSEVNTSGTRTRGEIYLGGRHLASYAAGTTAFDHSDWLGTVRVSTGAAGSILNSFTSLPFGDALNTIGSSPIHFTGKERDSESGLDNFGARYDSSSMGPFMTPDPVVITTERLYDPQQLNGYSYVRNNPLRFLDPTGMILQLSGNLAADKEEICRISGDACDRISVNEKTGVVTFNTEGLDLSANAGAALINDLVQSQSTFDFSISETVDTAGGTIKIDHIANLDNNPDDRYNYRKPPGKVDKEKPKQGVDDQVAINPNAHIESDNNLKKATSESVAFHELAEAYAKVEHSKQYEAAHQEAIQREQKLRDQRPYLKEHNPGSGPGDKLIIKR